VESAVVTELYESLLDDAALGALFDDYGGQIELLEVLAKGGAELRAMSLGGRLDEARDALVTGAVRGLQVRYRWDGGEWWDTLLRSPRGVKLVRMRQDAPIAG
jgi:hypothetical protein